MVSKIDFSRHLLIISGYMYMMYIRQINDKFQKLLDHKLIKTC